LRKKCGLLATNGLHMVWFNQSQTSLHFLYITVIIICREQDENVKLLTNFVELIIGNGKIPADRIESFFLS